MNMPNIVDVEYAQTGESTKVDEFGMRNHLNAAKASLLLFDSDLSYVPVPALPK